MRYLIVALCLVSVLVLNEKPAFSSETEPVYTIRFTDYEEGSIDDWLKGKGFTFERGAKNRSKIDFDIDDYGFEIEAKKKVLGLMPNESVNLSDFTVMEVDWGVHKQPAGASYEKGVRNEALMVFVFMGDENMPSGSMFIPDSPYFIGGFLCSGDDRINHPYVGSYFKKSGRYICMDQPAPGELVTSRFNLLEEYREFFDKENDDNPGISGVALGLDTGKAMDNGTAKAFIKEIRFYN